MPTQGQWEESEVGKAERLRISDHFNAMFSNVGTEPLPLTGKCFKCGKHVILGLDGIYEDKECCYDCFLRYFK
ncbi:MAG TPA: hypothetical protein VJZ49_15370 [Syntrophales bacterium]|nr:hypothetical protein [Syntrophales bacterium]